MNMMLDQARWELQSSSFLVPIQLKDSPLAQSLYLKFTFFKNPTNSIVLENNSASAALHSTKTPPVYVFLQKEYRKRVVKVNQIELQDFAIFAGSISGWIAVAWPADMSTFSG